MSNLAYIVEYAKTGNANCKVCKEKIGKAMLRFGISLQSKFYDGYQTHWHHEECFFKKVTLKSITEFEKFNVLQYDDIKRLNANIKHKLSAILDNQENTFPSVSKVNEPSPAFTIEYSKSSNAKCRHCDRKIYKDDIRISKSHYDPRFGDRLLWFHVNCFIINEKDLFKFLKNIEEISGFTMINEIDQAMIKAEAMTLTNYPSSKNMDDINEYLETIEKESKLFDHYRKELSVLNNNELKILIDENLFCIPKNREECLDLLADCMTFGVPELCPECKQGQLILDTFCYKCIGDTSAWSQCNYKTETPQRIALKIPCALRKYLFLQDYPHTLLQRHFYKRSSIKSKRSNTLEGFGPNRILSKTGLPLKNIQFYLYGISTASEAELKQRIINLGGAVVNKISTSTAAIITNREELEGKSHVMQEAASKGIEVIEISYFDLIDMENGCVTDSLQLIVEKNIANWGSNPFQRIRRGTLDKSSVYKAKRSKLKIKSGMVVDSDSGLENIAHVYKELNDCYSIVLSKTNVDDNKNSFYKLQLLEADSKERYWVFRSWGRTGTSIGGKKLEHFSDAQDAIKYFKQIYMQKTKYRDLSGHHFIKIPRAYVPVDINYDDIQISKIKIESNCSLPLSVQQMIVKIFDRQIIDNCLLEFELDIEKMPLGKISREQILFAYDILSGLLEDFDKSTITMDKIRDSSNKLYTIVPHNFGLKTPPLLDNIEIVKNKLEMLDTLLQVEIIYDLLDLASDDIISPIESLYLTLNAAITPIDKTSLDYNLVMKYLENTQYSYNFGYTIEIEEVFKVFRAGEEDRYNKYKDLHNKRLLWHGSRNTNIAGILSQGLRIAPPEAPVTGYMFGKGIYFADMIAKSANYCFVNKNHPIGFALLCEVALGNSVKCYKAENITLADNTHSVWGVGRIQPNPTEDILLENGTLVSLGRPEKTALDKRRRKRLDVGYNAKCYAVVNELYMYN